MWPVLVGIGIVTLLAKAFTEEDESDDEDRERRIFISFAIEDERYRDFLVQQAENERSPFSFIDMSVKEPWDNAVWKEKCRKKIRKCDGVIVLLSKNTWRAHGARWEIKCAKEEGIPVVAMHIQKKNKAAKLPELGKSKVIEWSWDNLEDRINRF